MRNFIPSKELTFHTVPLDRARLITYLQDTSATTCCVDLSRVTHCDSAGLALLIEAKRLARFYQKDFLIHQIPDKVVALIEFCGVKTILS